MASEPKKQEYTISDGEEPSLIKLPPNFAELLAAALAKGHHLEKPVPPEFRELPKRFPSREIPILSTWEPEPRLPIELKLPPEVVEQLMAFKAPDPKAPASDEEEAP